MAVYSIAKKIYPRQRYHPKAFLKKLDIPQFSVHGCLSIYQVFRYEAAYYDICMDRAMIVKPNLARDIFERAPEALNISYFIYLFIIFIFHI